MYQQISELCWSNHFSSFEHFSVQISLSGLSRIQSGIKGGQQKVTKKNRHSIKRIVVIIYFTHNLFYR